MNTQDEVYSQWLVLRAQSGDSGAMTRLVEHWQPRLWALARVLTDDEEEAWDVTQETWLAVVRDLNRVIDPTRFQPWLFRILRNKAADTIRRRQRRRAANVMTDEPSTEISASALDAQALLGLLPAAERELLSQHYLHGEGCAELASTLHVPLGTVKSRLHAARKKLRQLWEREHV